MAEYREAKAPEKRSYNKLAEIHIRKLANGGHVVSHHHTSDGMMAAMPKEHAFSKEDGADGTTHAHITEHLAKMGVHEASVEEHEGPESEVQAASEPASEDVNA